MDRLKGLASLVLITAGVMFGLRLLHVAVPLALPETRQGPIAIESLDDVRRQLGFGPLIPAYRPAALGAQPASMTVTFGPTPRFVIVWREGDEHLSVTQTKGGSMPDHPLRSQPLPDVADSTWWTDGTQSHLVLERGEFWIHLETSLSPRELRRFADTLTQY